MKIGMIWFIIALLLQGCGPKEEQVTVTLYVNKYVFPPKGLMRTYYPDKPIKKNVYLEMNSTEKERALTIYIVNLLDTVGKYRIQTDGIKTWRKENIYLMKKEERELNELNKSVTTIK